jgi:hypothetical protein
MGTNLARTTRRPLARRLAPVAGALACALTLGLLVAPDAAAGKPESLHFSDSFTEVDTETCGFPITLQLSFSADVQFYYDRDGNLDHSINHIRLRGTDTAYGVSLSETADFTHTYDFTTGVNGDLGLLGKVSVPGGGAIGLDAGRILSDDDGNLLFVAGRHDVLSGDASAYCGAFAA